ncbi:MAG TPA: hypothetical protein VJM33_05770 [Microthrixaceae bacterium]|nr:hypothetical protein [Microthrixaceae bacterium]
MKRRTLDVIFSVGGLVLAVLLGVLGFVLKNQADFAEDYVTDQLAAQQIFFTPEEGLTDEEMEAECLVENAGEPLTTGKQAECYANEYIGLHLSEINDGKTYSQTSTEARAARTEANAALETAPNDPATAELVATAEELEAKTESLFRGETLRGLLLTSYGFSIFGERAELAAWVCFGVALVLLLASIAGFIHAATTPKEEVVT